jgi:exonuclease SbcD
MGDEVWAEVVYEGRQVPDLRERVMEFVSGTKVEILKIRDTCVEARALGLDGLDFAGDNLTDIGELNESDVFARCMEKRSVPEEDRPELISTYRRVLASIYEEAGA